MIIITVHHPPYPNTEYGKLLMGGSCTITPSRSSSALENSDPNVNNSVNSNIVQVDGNDITDNLSSDDELSDDESNVTEYDTEDEIEPQTTPISISPVTKPNKRKMKILQASSHPLVGLLNARSLYNKADNLKTLLNELGLEIAIISEGWERDETPLDDLLQLKNYKIQSYKRPKVKARKQPGGGCAIIYNENRFKATKPNIHVPKGVEACWLILKPLEKNDLIENIAIGSIYVSPTSVYKTATIDHIIDTIHLLRTQYDNKLNVLIGGDVNKVKIDRILECYGPPRQIITTATRQSAILENVITDCHTMYQQPECLPPLQVDDDKLGKDSDQEPKSKPQN